MKRADRPLRHRLSTAGSWSAMLLPLVLAACGGGGGGGGAAPAPVGAQPSTPAPTPTPTPAGPAITGYVVEGPVAGAAVKLYQLDASGNRTLLGSAQTDANGAFSIPNTAPANAAILLEASGGSYVDEMTRQTVALGVALRAVSVSSGAAARIVVTPYSEAEVRVLEHQAKPDWSAAAISATHKLALDELGDDFLNFTPVNLQAAPSSTGTNENDLEMSLFTSGFGAYAKRLDANAATSMNSALEGMRRMLGGEEHDDAVLPAFIGGVVDFIGVSAFSDADKATLKTALLLADPSAVTPIALTADQASRFMPSGVSSGGATAPMPDDAFRLLGSTAGGTMFNYRGALIAYPLGDGSGRWRVPYTASVGEVFGDGDIGIGRWNGGTTVNATRSGDDLTPVTAAQTMLYGNWHYALARPVSNVPACGLRRLQLAGATRPTLASESVGAGVAATGLTADSSISFEYGDKILAGFDIGVIAPDGSVTRFTSAGGLAQPWASLIRIDPQAALGFSGSLQSGSSTALGANGLRMNGLVGGSGAAKLALKLSVGPSQDPTELAAAFVAPAGGLDTSACANAGANPGAAIDPAPVNGNDFLFAGVPDTTTYMGAPIDVTFRARGEVSGATGFQVGAATPVYELAGTADVSIGRIDGDFTLRGTAYHRSMPYAVARGGAALPSSGTRHYVLAASTLVVNDAFASNAGLPQGVVQSASLDINFGENPIGTGNPWYGTATLRLSGSIGGIPFSIGAPDSVIPGDAMYYRDGGAFSSNGMGYQGVLAAPSGNYAVVRFTAAASSVPVTGTLLFRAQ